MFQWLDHIWTKRSLCALTSVVALLAALASLSWRMVQDIPIMLYLSNMVVNQGAVPYRDFFDMNLPGSYLLYGLIVKVLGASDFAVHFSNMLFLFSAGLLLFFACPKPLRLCALFGVALATLRCYQVQAAFTLQRELVAFLPISALFALALRSTSLNVPKSLLTGLLLAGLALIKPQFLLYGLPQFVLLMMLCPDWRNRIYHLVIIGAAFSVPVLLCVVWLVRNGAWPYFLETVRYWGLYGQMTFYCRFVTPDERIVHTLRGIWKMAGSPYAVVAVLGLLVIWVKRLLPRSVCIAFAALFLLTLLIPAASGQFWSYHRMPFYYFALFLSGFLLSSGNRLIMSCVCIPMACLWTGLAAHKVHQETFVASAISVWKRDVPDIFAAYLNEHAQPGDTAQPIDWASGSLHGMLMADVPLATRFPYSFYFLHSLSHPLIQKIRREFLDSLDEKKPRFLLECFESIFTPNGIDTEKHFQAFEDWRDAHYHIVQENEHYRIWELTPR
ncbi:MAG: hypothetical protein FWG50_03430 [Kiritimatiellaeota bacterium]|nr:hypothetical protein [Kiritimatiellota bacterium]